LSSFSRASGCTSFRFGTLAIGHGSKKPSPRSIAAKISFIMMKE